MFSWIQITNASREAAAYAAFNPNDSGGITLRANQETNVQQQRGEGTLDIDVTCHRADNGVAVPCSTAFVAGLGSTVTVYVGEPFSFFTPLMNGLFPGFAIGAETTSFYMSGPDGNAHPVALANPVADSVPVAFGLRKPLAIGQHRPEPFAEPDACDPVHGAGLRESRRVVSARDVSTWTDAGFQAAQHHEQRE